MLTGIWLGTRLARAGGRFRAVLVSAGVAVAMLVLLVTAGVISTLPRPVSVDNRHFAEIVVLAVCLPVVALLAAVVRVSSSVRDRRLAALRILGVDTSTTRWSAAVETLLFALVGMIAGAAMFLATRPFLRRLDPDGTWFHGRPLSPWPRAWLLSVAGVVVVCAVVAASSTRAVTASPLAVRRQGAAKRPGLWRLAPFVIGLAIVGWTATQHGPKDGAMPPRIVLGFFVGSALLGLALPLVTAALIRLVADAMLWRARRPWVVLAARRLQQEPAGTTRLIATLLLAVFVITGARSVLTAFETTPQAIRAHRALTTGPQSASVYVRPGAALDVAALRTMPGVRSVTAYNPVPIQCPNAQVESDRFGDCGTALAARCSDLPTLRIFIHGCRDDRPTWLIDPMGAVEGAPLTPDDPTLLKMSLYSKVIGKMQLHGITSHATVQEYLDPRDPNWSQYGSATMLLIPPGSIDVSTVEPEQRRFEVVLDGGPTVFAHFAGAVSMGRQIEVGSNESPQDWQIIEQYRAILYSVAAALVAVALIALLITALDRMVERRRLLAALALVGVPVGVSRKSQLAQSMAPMLIGLPLAGLCGLLAGQCYLRIDDYDGLGIAAPWPAVTVMTALSLAAAIVVAALTVTGLGRAPRPGELRRE